MIAAHFIDQAEASVSGAEPADMSTDRAAGSKPPPQRSDRGVRRSKPDGGLRSSGTKVDRSGGSGAQMKSPRRRAAPASGILERR